MAGKIGIVWRLVASLLLLLAGCSGSPGTGEVGSTRSDGSTALEEPSGDFRATTYTSTSCSSSPQTGECRYLPVEAFSSSVEGNSSAYQPSQAIDSDCGTRWSSQFSDPQWLKVDLGSSRPLSRVVIHWENAASSNYELQVSDNASNWTKVATKANATITGSGNSRVDTIAGLTASARYVRVYSLARTTSYGNSIFELEVFGTGCGVTAGCSHIPVIPLSATASSMEHSAKGPEKAIDGQSSTRWSSAFTDNQWLQLDLGQPRSVGRVQIDWENAASAKYELQLSDSPTGPWSVIHTHQDNHVGPRTDDISGLVGSGRYLRVSSSKRTTSYGISIFEIRVFRSSCNGCEQVLVPSATAASSIESNAYPATKAVDGNYTTRWSSQFSDPQWLRLDFGQAKNINQVIIRWENSASKTYKLEGSNSSSGPWQVLAQRSNQPAGPRWDFIAGLDASVRFVRVNSTARTTTYGNSIYEIIVLGRSDTPCKGHGQCVEDTPPGQKVCDCGTLYMGPDCGGSTVPNSDGAADGDDLVDGCPTDPAKSKPLICGCNVSDVDSDGDQVPDCEDRCPSDPGNQISSPCGCAGLDNFRPSGTECIVEACSGSMQEATCNGQGQCGAPDCAPQANGCKFRIFRDHGYWFCDGDVSWQQAQTLCGEEPGRSMVQVDSHVENLWLTSVTGGDAWLGGQDLEQDGDWYWSFNGTPNHTPFWVQGLPIPVRFSQWQTGAPGAGKCLKLQANGTWVDAGCSEVRGFVCEQPVLRAPVPLEPPCSCDFYPGRSCDSCGAGPDPDPQQGDCVDAPELFHHTPNNPDLEEGNPDYVLLTDAVDYCTLNCPGPEPEHAAACADACPDFAKPPLGICPEFSATEQLACDLEPGSVHPTATCSVESPTCPQGYLCGRHSECAGLRADGQVQPCRDPIDCPAGQYCRDEAPRVCIDPAIHSECATKIVNAAGNYECVGVCFSNFACGIPNEECAVNEIPVGLSQYCSTTIICPDADTTNFHTNPLNDPNSNLTETVFPADAYFPVVHDEYPQPFPGADPGCGPPPQQPCPYPSGGSHPWCMLQHDADQKMDTPIKETDPAFQDEQGRDKRGTGGSDGPIRFDFDPNLDVGFKIDGPLGFGDAQFNAHANASALADAHFSLFGIDGDLSILDAGAGIDVSRCGVTSDARLKLFGFDFLPMVLGDEAYDKLNALDTPPETTAECNRIIGNLTKVVERAQKAMRDTQELLRQHKALVDGGKRFRPDLCQQLLEGPGKGVPANFPTAANPFKGCGNLTPEDTIKLFIEYYTDQVIALKAVQHDLLAESVKLIPPLNIDFLGTVDGQGGGQFDEANRETQEIANITFAIGPIPMNLTIEAFAQYGMAGGLTFALTPAGLAQAIVDGTSRDIASVNASLTPYAGAGVSMFVGIGFDFPGLSAKVGISGDVSLGTVTLPIYAKAAIKVAPEDDERPLPDDLDGMVVANQMIYPLGPPKKFRFEAGYNFGVDAHITDVLKGTINAKLRIEFFWFSKTWQKQIASFGPAIDPIHIKLISGGGGASFPDALGVLGYLHMPLAFVTFVEPKTPPALPPLPDPNTGGTGGTGTGGSSSGGSAGTGTGGSNRPPVSLFVEGDPRYEGFNTDRVVSLFYDGYCSCNAGDGGPCTSNLQCCDDKFCAGSDFSPDKFCVACIQTLAPTGRGEYCQTTEDCCDKDNNVTCRPDSHGTKYCQQCIGDEQPMEFQGVCCPDTYLYFPPKDGVRRAGAGICTGCRTGTQDCNYNEDCCGFDRAEDPVQCVNFRCSGPPK